MMMRRQIAILLIAFANIFILAHAVVPHYHHDGIVCFDSQKESKCTSFHIYDEGEECCCVNELADSHHTHLENCDLSQTVERNGDPSEDSISLSPYLSSLLVCISTFQCYDLLDYSMLVVSQLEKYKPYVDTYNSPYVGSIFGLRAPPHCIIA